MNSKNNRWWENYLVRYIVGNIFAVLVIFYLISFHGQKIQTRICGTEVTMDLCKKENGGFSSYVYGFIFTTNQELKIPNIEPSKEITIYQNKAIDIKEFISLIVNKKEYLVIKLDTTTINFVSVFMLGTFGFCYMYIASIPILFLHVTRGFLYSIIYSNHLGLKDCYDFLEKSTEIRRKDTNSMFVTSYQHAREHGNAYGIIVMEILFAKYLIAYEFSICALFYWLLVGFSVWFIGILLELKMVHNSK